jgi:TetR/AcrR family transcriptional repressor of nem operon
MTRKAVKGQSTRERIIQQSAPLFNQHGYAGTSMSALMTASGLEKGGIYRHFPNKQALAAAAFDFAWKTVSTSRLHGLDECTGALEKLLLLIRNFVEMTPGTVQGGCPLLNTAVDSDDGDPVLRARARKALTQWRSRIAQIIQKGQSDGELSQNIDAREVTVVIVASLEGAVMIGRLEKSRDALQAVGRHLEQYVRSLQA